jgi:hypothetical protein
VSELDRDQDQNGLLDCLEPNETKNIENDQDQELSKDLSSQIPLQNHGNKLNRLCHEDSNVSDCLLATPSYLDEITGSSAWSAYETVWDMFPNDTDFDLDQIWDNWTLSQPLSLGAVYVPRSAGYMPPLTTVAADLCPSTQSQLLKSGKGEGEEYQGLRNHVERVGCLRLIEETEETKVTVVAPGDKQHAQKDDSCSWSTLAVTFLEENEYMNNRIATLEDEIFRYRSRIQQILAVERSSAQRQLELIQAGPSKKGKEKADPASFATNQTSQDTTGAAKGQEALCTLSSDQSSQPQHQSPAHLPKSESHLHGLLVCSMQNENGLPCNRRFLRRCFLRYVENST